MTLRRLTLLPVILLLLVGISHAQNVDTGTSSKTSRIVPVCEIVLIDVVEGQFNWGLMDACWTGERLYLPLDSLSSKLGVAKLPSLAELDATAEPFLQSIANQDSTPAIYFFDTENENRLFADGGILGIALGVEFEFAYLEMRLRIYAPEPSPRKARIERLSSLSRRVRPSEEYPNALKLSRKRYMLHTGKFIWNISGTQTYDARSANSSNGYFGNVNYRTELLGGAFSIAQSFRNNRSLLDERPDMSLLWDTPSLKWLESIKVGVQNAPLSQSQLADGLSITNRPTYPRTSAGNWFLDGVLPTGWDLEVLQGNYLVGFEMATLADTPYNFSLPLSFGQNNYTARWYNATGLQRELSYLLYIPSRAIPEGEFEYTFSAGKLRSGSRGNYGTAQFSYGVLPNLTVTNDMYGVEAASGNIFYNMRPGFTFTDAGGNAIEGKYGLKGGYELGYQRLNLGSGNVGVNYIRNKPEELESGFLLSSIRRTITGFADQRFRIRNTFGNISVRSNWSDFGRNENLTTSVRAQLSRARLQSTISYNRTFSRLEGERFVSAFDQLSLGAFRSINRYWSMSGNLTARPSSVRFQSASLGAQRGFRRFFFSGDARYDYQFKSFGLFITGRFQLNQLGINSQVQSLNNVTISSATLYGNIAYNPGHNRVFFDYLNLPDRTGIAVAAFIDTNGNRKHDKGETFVADVDVDMVRGGRKILDHSGKTVTRIADLFPYQEYYLKVGSSMDYPDYKPTHPVIRFIAEPNRWKTILVPMQPTVEVILFVTSANALAPNTATLKLKLEPVDGDGETYQATSFNDGTIYMPQVVPGRYRMVWDDQQFRIRGLGIPMQDILEIKTEDAPALETNIVLPVRR